MTVLDAIQRSGDFLARKGVDSPRLQAELLLAHVLGVARMKLYLSFDRTLSVPEADAYRVLVQRRGTREPLQHIVGTVSFCGLEMAVNGDVLIPRPETELLVEQAIGWVQAQAKAPAPARTSPVHVLDFGTGSGCIAVAIVVNCPEATVTAVDVSATALNTARANARRHGVEARVRFVEGAGFATLPSDSRFDLLVSNPPYIPTAEIATLDPEVRDYDPSPALDGGVDGLRYYRMISEEGKRWMNPGGAILVELGDGQAKAVQSLLADSSWQPDEPIRDYSGRERILIARRTS